jgi:hypothetical protein
MANEYIEPPKDKLGMAVLKGMGAGALGAAAVTADAGNPFLNAGVGTVAGGIISGVRNIKQSLDYSQAVRNERKAHRVTNTHQFK